MRAPGMGHEREPVIDWELEIDLGLNKRNEYYSTKRWDDVHMHSFVSSRLVSPLMSGHETGEMMRSKTAVAAALTFDTDFITLKM